GEQLVPSAASIFFLTCPPAGIYSHLNAPQVTPGLAGSPPPGPRGRFWSSRAGVFLHPSDSTTRNHFGYAMPVVRNRGEKEKPLWEDIPEGFSHRHSCGLFLAGG